MEFLVDDNVRRAAELLKELLEKEPRKASYIENWARINGISMREAKKAKKFIGATVISFGPREFYWKL